MVCGSLKESWQSLEIGDGFKCRAREKQSSRNTITPTHHWPTAWGTYTGASVCSEQEKNGFMVSRWRWEYGRAGVRVGLQPVAELSSGTPLEGLDPLEAVGLAGQSYAKAPGVAFTHAS